MSSLGESPFARGAGRTLRHGSVHYELLERLGGGGSGEVHLARVVGGGLERRVCIKRLAGSVAPEEAAVLREEARLLSSVRHANVVSLLGFAEDEQLGPFLVLELVEGLDLRELRRRLGTQRLADPVAVHVACSLLRACSAVQRCLPGLVHRDITPNNVLVSVHGEVKLADFGIALARDRTRWTAPFFVKGKVGYMSPEQIRGEPLDPRSDLFAVGVILYELLAGERPWGTRRPLSELRAAVSDAPGPLASRRPDVPAALALAVDRLLERLAHARFATADDALRSLAPFGAGELGSLRLASLVEALAVLT
ncbi:MAG TPA: serine/threonine-protein kinase [Polyangiaceae bacterium]